jgi:hypothetical protein
MRNSIWLWVAAVATFTSLSTAANEKIVLYPLERVSVDASTADAIERSLKDEFQAKGYIVVDGDAANATSPPVTPASETGEAPASPAQEEGATEAETPEKETDKAAAAVEDSDESAETTAPAEAVMTRSDQTRELGCRYYITGSIVRLGNQTTLMLSLSNVDAGTLSAKKVVARNDSELPRAVTTITSHIGSDLDQHIQSNATEAGYADGAPGSGTAPAAPPKSKINFEKNLGIAIGQAISVKDEMYSFTSFNFNGRFEFNQILLVTTAGFAMGNREFENGFHFNLDIALAGYLTRTQVAPYLGAGVGLFVGNKLDHCPGDDDDNYYSYDEDSCYEDDSLVGWEVFPVIGVEILRTFNIRLHVEGRYLLAFNAYKDWGHGPMMMIGVAF